MLIPSVLLLGYSVRLSPGGALAGLLNVSLMSLLIDALLLLLGTVTTVVLHEVIHYVSLPRRQELRLVANSRGGLYLSRHESSHQHSVARKPYVLLLPTYVTIGIGTLLIGLFDALGAPYILPVGFGVLVLSYRSLFLHQGLTDHVLFLRMAPASRGYERLVDAAVLVNIAVLVSTSAVVLSLAFFVPILAIFNSYMYGMVNRLSSILTKGCIKVIPTHVSSY